MTESRCNNNDRTFLGEVSFPLRNMMERFANHVFFVDRVIRLRADCGSTWTHAQWRFDITKLGTAISEKF